MEVLFVFFCLVGIVSFILGIIFLSDGDVIGFIMFIAALIFTLFAMEISDAIENDKSGATAKNKVMTVSTEYTIHNGDTLVTDCDTTYVIKN